MRPLHFTSSTFMLAAAFLAVAVGGVGCAGPRMTEPDAVYTGAPHPAAPATALVFDPPVTQYTPANLSTDREARQASAYLGYEASSTVGVVTFDDRQYYSDAYRGSGRDGGYGLSGSLGHLDRQAYQQTAVVRQR